MAKLYEIPTIPEEIEQAALDGKLILFVGAGVSRLLGCPSWDGLADAVLKELAKSEVITFGDIQSLKGVEAKKKLSVATQIAFDAEYSINYKNLLRHDDKKSSIYSHINAIGCAYVTTNYDLLINPVNKSKTDTKPGTVWRMYRPEDFLAGRLREPCTVTHLHGCLKDPMNMIVTTKQYLELYDSTYVQDFLGEMFERHTVLFVGYGLEESEILEHILRRGRVSDEANKRRFMLQGFYADQQNLHEWLGQYYRSSFGVHLIGFLLDRREHKQLEGLIENWALQLEVRDPSLIDDIDYIEEVLGE